MNIKNYLAFDLAYAATGPMHHLYDVICSCNEFVLGKAWCVYFLFNGNTVVYIGSTDSVSRRVKSHRKDKQFDAIRYIGGFEEAEARSVEETLIRRIQPRYNTTHNDKAKRPT